MSNRNRNPTTHDAPRASGYVAVPSHVARAVSAFIAEHSERAAAEHFALSRITIARAASGLVVQASTLLALEDGLARAAELPPTKAA